MGTEVYELADSLLAELLESSGHHRVLERYRANHPWDANSVSLVLALIEDLYSSGRLRYPEYQSLRTEIATWSPAGIDEATDEFPTVSGIDVEDPTEELEDGHDATAILPLTPDLEAALREQLVVPASPQPAAPPAPPALESGTTLADRYVLERQIGGGGYSLVFQARDRNRETLGSGSAIVAIKVLRPQWNRDQRAVARLKQEFAVASQLAHPGIVRVHDVGCDRGQWFLALEYLDGESLDRRLRDRDRGSLTREQSLAIATACAEAVDFAHARGVIHGDLKPGNIFLTANGEVRLFDWAGSIASADSPPAEGRAATPAYASPQVLDGRRPDQADDVFSLAVICCEMLAHRHPFDRGASSAWRNADRHPDLTDALPESTATALAAGLAWSPEDRPGSARELVAAITRPPTEARVDPAPEQLQAVETAGASAADPSVEATAPAHPSAALPVPIALPRALPALSVSKLLRDAPPWLRAALVGALVVLLALVLLRPTQRPATPSAASGPPVAATAPTDAGFPPISFTDAPSLPANALPLAPLTAGIDAPDAAHAVPEPSLMTAAATTTQPAAAPVTPPAPVRATWVSFESQEVTTSEAAVSAVLRIQRLEELKGRARVSWRTVSGTAIDGEDFEGVASGVAEFAIGQTVRAIYIKLLPDALPEGTESFVVELASSRRNVRIGPIAQATVTIRDDD
jgi:serine/threonine protein kinase